MKIFNLNINSITSAELITSLVGDLKNKHKRLLAFANVNTLNISYDDDGYSSILQDFQIVNDGVGVDLAANILHGKPFLQNLNGTDFMPELFSHLPKGCKVFFLAVSRRI